MRIFFAVIVLIILPSCAITSQVMENNLGQQRECSAFGWGLIGTTVALVSQSNCEDRLRKAGFVNVEDRETLRSPTKKETANVADTDSIGTILKINELKKKGYDYPDWTDKLNVYFLINKNVKDLPNGNILVRAAMLYKQDKLN